MGSSANRNDHESIDIGGRMINGPWVVPKDDKQIVKGPRNATIAFVSVICKTDEEIEAIARLVSAAPDMLEVLEMIVNNDKESFSEKLHTAIAKAKGEMK